ncbi:MAG: porin [Nitrospirales bacterium]|nr:OprO/OprP family phosphate-selective porin [Nitrospirales bacterium]
MFRWLAVLGFFMAVAGGSGGLEAAELQSRNEREENLQDTPVPKTLEERLEELERKMRDADGLRELDQQREEQRAKDAPVVGVDHEGFFLRSANRAFELRFGGYGQVDGRFFFGDTTQSNVTNTFEIRRFRPILEGTLYRHASFKLMPDFQQGRVVLVDGYIGFDFWTAFRLRVGKFKPPVGLEMLQSSADTSFIERGLPLNLIPNRDIGAQLYGDLFEKHLAYQVGVFNGVRDDTSTTGGSNAGFDSNSDKDYMARLFAQPFLAADLEWLQGLQMGVSGTWGRDNFTPSNFQTPATGSDGITFFRYRSGVRVAGNRYRLSPQTYYAWGPLGVLAEYVWNIQDLRTSGNAEKRLTNRAWQIAVSYVLTGENASFAGVKPWRLFNPAQGSWGAVELAARYQQLLVDREAFPVFADPAASARKARVWTVGINWHLAHRLKVQVNYEHGVFDGGAPNNKNFEKENALLTRLQVAW